VSKLTSQPGTDGAGYDPVVYAKHVHLQSLPADHAGRPTWEIVAAVAVTLCALAMLLGLRFVPDRESRPVRPSAG
jgi:hypothetical protein